MTTPTPAPKRPIEFGELVQLITTVHEQTIASFAQVISEKETELATEYTDIVFAATHAALRNLPDEISLSALCTACFWLLHRTVWHRTQTILKHRESIPPEVVAELERTFTVLDRFISQGATDEAGMKIVRDLFAQWEAQQRPEHG